MLMKHPINGTLLFFGFISSCTIQSADGAELINKIGQNFIQLAQAEECTSILLPKQYINPVTFEIQLIAGIFQCPSLRCQQLFDSQPRLRHHILMTLRPLKCKLCSKRFTWRTEADRYECTGKQTQHYLESLFSTDDLIKNAIGLLHTHAPKH